MSDSTATLRRRETATNVGNGDCQPSLLAKNNNDNEEGSGDCQASSSAKDNKSNESKADPPSSKPPSPVVKTKLRRLEWATYADLSAVETIFYMICATSSILYVCYRVYLLSPTVIRFVRVLGGV